MVPAPAGAFLLNSGKCFPDSLFLFPLWKIIRRWLPPGCLEMASTVEKAGCELRQPT